jgi:antitoxin MazE
VETEHGILITPFDPDFADAMAAYEESAKKYRNALRELAK